VAAAIAMGIILPKMCPNTLNNLFQKTETPVETPVETLRFQKVETFSFEKRRHGFSTAVIYKDTKTGVKYLYVWHGQGRSGGPCITRLWEK